MSLGVVARVIADRDKAYAMPPAPCHHRNHTTLPRTIVGGWDNVNRRGWSGDRRPKHAAAVRARSLATPDDD